MRKQTIVITVVILVGIILVSVLFMSKQKGNVVKDLPPGTHGVAISEVIQTSKYTYFLVEENDNEYWMAVNKREAEKGDVIYYTNPLEMKNFVSKELGRTFPVIYFVQDVSGKPVIDQKASSPDMTPKRAEIIKKENINVNRIKGGITISELYENQQKYAGNTVKIRGEVTRYNPMVMGKNWVHIQDGSEYSGQFDLAVTTLDSIAVGNTATFTGKISLKKDFGAGYFYPVIMEEAKAAEIEETQ